jgi:hypothetical protein
MKREYALIIQDEKDYLFNKKQRKNREEILEALGDSCLDLIHSPFRWFLVGGLATDLQIGKITRDHKDLDIEISSKDSKRFINFMISKGYLPFQNFRFFNFDGNFYFSWKRFLILRRCSVRNYLPGENIKFVKMKNNRIINRQYVDVFFTKRRKGKTTFGNSMNSFDLVFSYIGPIYTLPKIKMKIRTRNPIYHFYLERIENREEYKKDFKFLKKLIPKSDFEKAIKLSTEITSSRKIIPVR